MATNKQISTGADFDWLKSVSDNGRCEATLDEIYELNQRFIEEGILPKSEEELCLDLVDLHIHVAKRDSLRAVKDFTQIFKNDLHMLVRDFWGEEDDTILDVGANLGFYSLKIKQRNKDAKIIAIEPSKYAFKYLKKNVSANNMVNIEFVNKAVADTDGEIVLHEVQNASALSGKFKPSASDLLHSWVTRDMVTKSTVSSTTLQSIFNEKELDKVGIMKLDVQDMELEILLSNMEMLDRISKIVVQPHSTEAKAKIHDLLSLNGFTLLFDENRPFGDMYFVS